MSYARKVILLIMAAAIVKLLVAVSTELGIDEAYYWVYATDLQWNYFDHPPLVALLIKATTFNLRIDNALFIRLGPVLCSSAATWIIYKTATLLKDEKAGWLAALLFTTSPYCSIIAGLFILPDAPLLLWWTLALYLLVRLTAAAATAKSVNRNLLWWGIVCGLAVMSKVQAVLLWGGLGMYILLHRRAWLRNGYLWVSVLITAIIASPILLWNINNRFATYSFHSARVTPQWHFEPDSLLRELLGGVLYNNPVNYIVLLLVLTAVFKGLRFVQRHQLLAVCWVSLPVIAIFLGISFFRETLPHWSAPGYTGLILLAGCGLCHFSNEGRYRWALRMPGAAAGLLLGVLLAGSLLINFYPGTLGKKDLQHYGDGDFTLDMYGWQQMGRQFAVIHARDTAAGWAAAPLISNNWMMSAHLHYYVARPLGLPLLALGDPADVHQYHWLNEKWLRQNKLSRAYLLVPSTHVFNVSEQYGQAFELLPQTDTLVQHRKGDTARIVIVYRLQKKIPW